MGGETIIVQFNETSLDTYRSELGSRFAVHCCIWPIYLISSSLKPLNSKSDPESLLHSLLKKSYFRGRSFWLGWTGNGF